MESNPHALRRKAYAVHLFTASGIVPAALAMHEVVQIDTDPRLVFLYLILCTFIDAADGPLARRYHVKAHAAAIDGRTIDDVLDYLTFAFIPLMLVWRMEWMPVGLGWTVAVAMGASLFGFAHREAKDEAEGFLRGFPSYWNVFAFYAGFASTLVSPWVTAVSLWGLAVLTVSPIQLIYPNLAPPPWRGWLLGGAMIWGGFLVFLLWDYPHGHFTWWMVSLIYPFLYTLASLRLAQRSSSSRAV